MDLPGALDGDHTDEVAAVVVDEVVAGVLFDLFGTIVAPFSKDGHDHALTVAAEALGLDPARCISAWQADYDNRVRGRSGDIAAQLRTIADAQGIEVDSEQLDFVVASYATFCDEAMEPVPTAASTLAALAERSVPIGLVSNTAPDLAAAFERSPLRLLFATCTFSCAIGAAKPDRAIYAAAAQALGIEPARLLFVGDGSDDELAGAARAGLTPALVEAETTDTYDPGRHAVGRWSGMRLRDLSDVLALVL
ncbi:MAG TPA: HAD-IA family hydrolase [Acidimicrobiales bacterium]|nr:HAD-IA family hydrolase [Acidimicrobiales bacterium]